MVDSDSDGDDYKPEDDESEQDDHAPTDDFADDMDLDVLGERDRSDDANPRVMLISLKAVSSAIIAPVLRAHVHPGCAWIESHRCGVSYPASNNMGIDGTFTVANHVYL